MRKKIHIKKGQVFGRLTFIKETEPKSNRRRGLFLCDCGNSTECSIHDARSGHTTSCGCYHTERIREAKKHGELCGHKSSTEYKTWKAIKGRCYYKKNVSYHNYGGRGIKVCDRWINSFENFLSDMGRKPDNSYSIDRINNDKGYNPENCRWATRSEQRRNGRGNLHYLTLNGKTQIIADWAKETDIRSETILSRIRNGWSTEDAIFKPLRKRII